MKSIILTSALLLIISACSKSPDYKALKIDTMLQNKTIDRLFKEKDSLERELLLDSLTGNW